jgi:hypothetical protein
LQDNIHHEVEDVRLREAEGLRVVVTLKFRYFKRWSLPEDKRIRPFIGMATPDTYLHLIADFGW